MARHVAHCGLPAAKIECRYERSDTTGENAEENHQSRRNQPKAAPFGQAKYAYDKLED